VKMRQSDQFNGRLGLIFASIGAAIGTGNIWRFPRMVGANGGGTFLVPWLDFPVCMVDSARHCRICNGEAKPNWYHWYLPNLSQERNLLGWVCGQHGFPQRSGSTMRLFLDGPSSTSNSESAVHSPVKALTQRKFGTPSCNHQVKDFLPILGHRVDPCSDLEGCKSH